MAEPRHTSLAGKRIVVTRAAAQVVELLKALQYSGAIPILLPVIQILPPENFAPLDEALNNIASFDWVLFTSQNSVRILHERMELLSRAHSSAKNLPLAAAVGAATAAAATAAGFAIAHIASRPLGLKLVDELAPRLVGKRVLLPRSDRANPDVLSALQKIGARVSEIVAYRTVAAQSQEHHVVSRAMNADAVLFFSHSAVDGFDAACGAGKLAEFSATGLVLASGPVTLAALRARGLASATAAKEPSVARIVEALANSFAAREPRVASEAH